MSEYEGKHRAEYTHHPERNKEHFDLPRVHSEPFAYRTKTQALEDLPPITQEVIKNASIETHRKPKLGDDVHYILSSGSYKGEHRSARVVKIWSDSCVQLTVYTDWQNDFEEGHPGANGLFWATSVTIDPAGEREGSWHWPEE